MYEPSPTYEPKRSVEEQLQAMSTALVVMADSLIAISEMLHDIMQHLKLMQQLVLVQKTEESNQKPS